MRVSELLRLLPENKRGLAREVREYSCVWVPLAANASNAPDSITTNDEDFYALAVTAYVTTVAAPPVENATPQMTFTMQVGNSAIFPDDNGVHIANCAISTADRRWRELPFPIYVPPVTALKVLMTNLTATAANIYMSFWGLALLDYQRGTRAV